MDSQQAIPETPAPVTPGDRPPRLGRVPFVDNTAAIVRAINKGLTAMHPDGTYARIQREHGLAE